ncbi:MAG: UvrD-helicase domain-containing protein, partial [Oryzomonas sp.]
LYGVDFEKANRVLATFDFYCNSAITDFSQIAVDDDIIELVRDFYSQMRTGWIEMTHSWYLKEFQISLSKGGLKLRQSYGYCLLDEAQDTNPVTLSIFNHLPGMKIKVGDRHQAIYGFRGAVNALGEAYSKPSKNVTRMSLSTTFRCNPLIVEHANWILGTFKGETMKLVSGNNRPVPEKIGPQAFITRTNSGLIEYVDSLPDFNLTRTPDLIFECLMSLMNWKYSNYNAVSKPYKFLTKFHSMQQLNEYVEQTSDQEIQQGLKLLEKFDGAEVWAKEGLGNGEKIRMLYRKAQDNYSRNGQSLVTLTTAHSSKGLEFDRCLLSNDFPDLVMVMAKLIKEKIIEEPADFLKSQKAEVVSAREEANLYYVATTRAKYELLDSTANNQLYQLKLPLEQIFYLARQSA